MRGKNRALLALTILFILIIIIPVAQTIYLNNWIAEVSVEEVGKNAVEIAVKKSQNDIKAFLGTFIVNFFINIADGLLITAMLTWLLTEVLSIEKTDPRTGIKTSNRGKVAVFVGAITFFGLYVAFKDIYSAGFGITESFGNVLDAFSDGVLRN